MVRKRVPDLYHGIYHVIQRGNNRSYIFKEPQDKEFFLQLLIHLQKHITFQLLGYVIMDNHYHLIIKRNETTLSTIMQHLNRGYSAYYNKTYKRSGSIYDRRYNKFLVEDDRYLLSLLKYIHYNPVRANMVPHVSSYTYSSDSHYRKNIEDTFVHIQLILNRIHENRKHALEHYIAFMDDHKKAIKAFHMVTDRQLLNYLYHGQLSFSKPSLLQLLNEVCKDQTISDLITSGSRKRDLTPYKTQFIFKALNWSYSQKEISNFLKVSEATICLLKKKGSNYGYYC